MMQYSFAGLLLQRAQMLAVAYLGLVNGLFDVIASRRPNVQDIAESAQRDPAYVSRWVDAAASQGLVAVDSDGFLSLTDLSDGLPMREEGAEGARILQAVYSVLLADRIVPRFLDGHRPGYKIVQEFENLVPFYATIAESLYGPVFEEQVLPRLDFLCALNRQSGRVLDYQCGDGWLLRHLGAAYSALELYGIGSSPNLLAHPQNAFTVWSEEELLGFDESFDMIILHKVAHHLGSELEGRVADLVSRLTSGGRIVIWDFSWPPGGEPIVADDRSFLNLIEHAQGSEYVSEARLTEALVAVSCVIESFHVRHGLEVIIIGRRCEESV
jgi:SAM-dependent methyltransferase